jgi:hypothetical protein
MIADSRMPNATSVTGRGISSLLAFPRSDGAVKRLVQSENQKIEATSKSHLARIPDAVQADATELRAIAK